MSGVCMCVCVYGLSMCTHTYVHLLKPVDAVAGGGLWHLPLSPSTISLLFNLGWLAYRVPGVHLPLSISAWLLRGCRGLKHRTLSLCTRFSSSWTFPSISQLKGVKN